MIAAFKLDDVKDREEPFSENGQIQIDYVTEQILPMLTEQGAWIAPGPSPLGVLGLALVGLGLAPHLLKALGLAESLWFLPWHSVPPQRCGHRIWPSVRPNDAK
jgi:hypothetical protein